MFQNGTPRVLIKGAMEHPEGAIVMVLPNTPLVGVHASTPKSVGWDALFFKTTCTREEVARKDTCI